MLHYCVTKNLKPAFFRLENVKLCIGDPNVLKNHLKNSDSELQVSRFELFDDVFYPLDSVRHGDCGRSSLNNYIQHVSIIVKGCYCI